MIKDLLKYHRLPLLMLLSCCALYFSFAYDLDRVDFPKLISLYLALAFLSWKLFQMEKTYLPFLLGASLLFRLVFLFHIPSLSPDFYRFLWDGQLVLNGINPYLYTPQELMPTSIKSFSNTEAILAGMSELSTGNHSNYPPLSQLIFALAALFTGKSLLGGVIALRLLLISAEVGIYYFGRKLLKGFGLPENRIFWFLLNPLIIIELTGNLHFEGVMIFFLLWALYMLQKGNWRWAAVIFGLSVSVKLIPLLFLPLLLPYFISSEPKLRYWRFAGFCLLVGFTFILGFLPFFSPELLVNYMETLGLWFQTFEFNASVYYLVRWLGFQVYGYNIIGTAGMVMGALVFFGVLGLTYVSARKLLGLTYVSAHPPSWPSGQASSRPSGQASSRRSWLFLLDGQTRRSAPTGGMGWGILIYYLMATTVHPWYLALPLVLCIFSGYRYPLVWGVTVVLSYSAYTKVPAEENLWLVAVEYLIVLLYFGYEVREKMRNQV